MQYDIDKNVWELKRNVLNAMKKVKKYIYHEGGKNKDQHIRLWLEPEDESLFTPYVHNTLKQKLEEYYGGFLLLEYRYVRPIAKNKTKNSK